MTVRPCARTFIMRNAEVGVPYFLYQIHKKTLISKKVMHVYIIFYKILNFFFTFYAYMCYNPPVT